MADDNRSIIDWLFGRSPSETVSLAPPMKNYPTHEDADFARKYDYSYGQPWAPEFEGHSARLQSGNLSNRPLKSEVLGTDRTTIDKLVPGKTDALRDVYARAALASEGSGLAKLGFDTNKILLDPARKSEDVTVAGAYFPHNDQIYANVNDQRDPSTPIHESIHRGLHLLKNTPYWKPEFNEMMSDPDMNEYMVRYLMRSKMGDPEAADLGAVGKAQQGAAELAIGRNERRRKLIDEIDAAAAQAVAARRPGGPR